MLGLVSILPHECQRVQFAKSAIAGDNIRTDIPQFPAIVVVHTLWYTRERVYKFR